MTWRLLKSDGGATRTDFCAAFGGGRHAQSAGARRETRHTQGSCRLPRAPTPQILRKQPPRKRLRAPLPSRKPEATPWTRGAQIDCIRPPASCFEWSGRHGEGAFPCEAAKKSTHALPCAMPPPPVSRSHFPIGDAHRVFFCTVSQDASAASALILRVTEELPADRREQFEEWIQSSALRTLADTIPAPPVAAPFLPMLSDDPADLGDSLPPLDSICEDASSVAASDAVEKPLAAPAPVDGAAGASSSAATAEASDSSVGTAVIDAAGDMPPPPPRTPPRHGPACESAPSAGSGASTSSASAFDAELSRQLFLDQLAGCTAPASASAPFAYFGLSRDGDEGAPATTEVEAAGAARMAAAEAAAARMLGMDPIELALAQVMADGAEAPGAAGSGGGDFSHYIKSPARARNAIATPPSSKHSGRAGGKRHRNGDARDMDVRSGGGEPVAGGGVAPSEDDATRVHVNGEGCGEGLSALISHLTAQRQPQVQVCPTAIACPLDAYAHAIIACPIDARSQAWLLLKDELMKADEALMFAEGWDDLNDLEADFHHINAQHLTNKSWLVA